MDRDSKDLMSETSIKKAVALVSGGLDSAVSAAIASSMGFEVYALTVHYGQRHEVELKASRRVCRSLNVAEHKVISVDLRQFGGSALTDDILVPKGDGPIGAGPIPATYVPARNTVFLSLALSWAEALGAYEIFIGVSSVDYSGYPDCRPEYIQAFENLANLGTKVVDSQSRFHIHAPVVRLSKEETILKGLELGVDFSHTWTCYDPTPEGRPCGGCESCRLRAKGFEEAGLPDPALTRCK